MQHYTGELLSIFFLLLHFQGLFGLTCLPASPSATYPAAYGLVGQPFPHQPTLVAQQPQQPQQLQQREGEWTELANAPQFPTNYLSKFPLKCPPLLWSPSTSV